MRSARRRPSAHHSVHLTVTALLTVGLAGPLAACGSIGDAQQVIDRARLVNDLASRLDRATELTYTAEYQMPDGSRYTIAQAQQPVRVAYTYPGGKVATTPDASTDCLAAAAVTCTLTGPPSPATDAQTELSTALHDRALVSPTLVIGLLTAASLSSNAVIRQHDTTIAGEPARCVDVTGVENSSATQFDACITSTGVLGSFNGTVDGKLMSVSLIRYLPSVAPDAFGPLAGAKIVDRRPAPRADQVRAPAR
jgi:hypothetical protein